MWLKETDCHVGKEPHHTFRTVFLNADNTKSIQLLRADGFDSLSKISDLQSYRLSRADFRRNMQEKYDRILLAIQP